MNYKYSLDRTSKKWYCPECQKKTFVKYIDNETREYIEAGRCDRESKCGYHFKPNDIREKKEFVSLLIPSPKIYIPFDILKKSRSHYECNSFVQHLRTLFDEATVIDLIKTYHIGSSNGRWPGACLFWFIDKLGRIHAGQVKLFKEGHTAKEDGKSCTTWIHSILKGFDWLNGYKSQERKVDCLFGEHLIKDKPIAIVEAPATAIVASVYLPKFTWLASGSLSYLNDNRCKVLLGKKVTLFPDNGGYKAWKEVAEKLGFECSDLLEKNDVAPGSDLRDYLERMDIQKFIKPEVPTFEIFQGRKIEMHPAGYPLSWN